MKNRDKKKFTFKHLYCFIQDAEFDCDEKKEKRP